MVLNALAIDPRRTWKGSWRWFHEQMLDCCRPLEDVKREGNTLPQAACLARCNGARVEMQHQDSFSVDKFRQVVSAV
jgi:glutathione gamma-glutamylcysteinyltransferase